MKKVQTPQASAAMLPVQWNLRVYPATPVVLLHDALTEAGIDAAPALAAAGLSLAQVRSPATRISRQQLLAAFKAVIAMRTTAPFAFRTGLGTRLTYFGMYGFALMSAPDMRTMLQFSVEQHALTGSLIRLWTQRHGDEVEINADPFPHRDIDARLYRFLVELSFGILQRGWCDLTGADFKPLRLCVTYPECPSTRDIAASLGVPVLFAQHANAFVLDAAWLDAHPQFGNLIAHDSVRDVCVGLIAQLKEHSGLAGQIGKSMVTHYGHIPGIEGMAATLGMSDRELRRRLRVEGTSYREIHDDVRSQVAMRYLRDTAQSVESIAAAVGFGDAANFRRAFRRWTGKTPLEFRASTAATDPEP